MTTNSRILPQRVKISVEQADCAQIIIKWECIQHRFISPESQSQVTTIRFLFIYCFFYPCRWLIIERFWIELKKMLTKAMPRSVTIIREDVCNRRIPWTYYDWFNELIIVIMTVKRGINPCREHYTCQPIKSHQISNIWITVSNQYCTIITKLNSKEWCNWF